MGKSKPLNTAYNLRKKILLRLRRLHQMARLYDTQRPIHYLFFALTSLDLQMILTGF